jgi:hypothetical protein
LEFNKKILIKLDSLYLKMILNKKNNRSTMQPTGPAQQAINNSFNETDQFFNDFSQFNHTGYSTSTQHQQQGI